MDRFEQTRKIGVTGLLVNIGLAIIKLGVGFLGKSSAMIADGFNSAGDVFSSSVTLIGNKVASKPKDEDHPYGHGKAEYICSGIIGLSLLVVAWSTLRNSVEALMNPSGISNIPLLILVAAITIVTKLSLFFHCNKIGKNLRNPLILANSQDHRADVFVSLGTIIGIIGASLGFYWLDAVVGILISAWIARAAYTILKDSFWVLMDTAEKAGSPIVLQAKDIIHEIDVVDHIDAVTARPVGNRFSIIIKISVPGDMSVLKSHHITRQIKDRVLENPDVADVTIHVNPLEEHAGPSIL